MYRNLVSRWFHSQPIQKECLRQLVSTSNNVTFKLQHARHFSISAVCSKKRKSPEEKAVENTGRRVIRYAPKSGSQVVGIWRNMTVAEIAQVLDKDLDHIYEALEFADKDSTIDYTPKTVINNPRIIRDVVKILGCRSKIIPPPDEENETEENKDVLPRPPAPAEALRPRPPVVCVMGHVDHGKTTLLDSLRNTSVVDQEFGGITQHIGAFQVTLQSGEQVTFLDTPGHAAFTSMRSRGANATDIVVLVVAADDGVMEQTVESIRMAREANVPILVAVNKVDKPGVNIDKTLRSLAQHGIICETLGGDTQAIAVSALKRTNLDVLVEALSVQAQLMDLKAEVGGFVEGVVLEALIDSRTGKQATVLVQRGTLRRGSVIVAGMGWAKVRVLNSAEGTQLLEAPPSTPVQVLGWRELPSAGDQVLEVASEPLMPCQDFEFHWTNQEWAWDSYLKHTLFTLWADKTLQTEQLLLLKRKANEVMKFRAAQRMKEKQLTDLEAIREKEMQHQTEYKETLRVKRSLGRYKMKRTGPREKMFKEDTHPTLSVVVKGDVDGSVEAILDILETYDDHNTVKLDLVHFGVGQISPNDVEIAEAFDAIIYAFNVPCPPSLASEAKQKNITVRHHNVIYKLVDDVKEELSARIPIRQEEEVIGEANVLQQFLVSEGKKKVPVAGCRCVKGSLSKAALYKVVRAGEVVHRGKLASMKHLKDEVTTIKRDQECGLRFEDTTFEMTPGDTIVCYKLVDVSDKTSWDPGF